MFGAHERDGFDFWLDLWKLGRSTWQERGILKLLKDNQDVVLAGKRDAQVFLPLCGKANELKWFLDLGHRVVGVEFVEDCVSEYFTENNFEAEETTCPVAGCKVLQTLDRRLKIFVCSIFDFKRECAGPMDIVWDRSGFTAIPENDRPRYAAVLKSLLAPDFSYGMWTVVYNAPSYKGAPRSAGDEALREHFGDTANLALVATSVEHHELFLGGRGPVTHCLWHLQPRITDKLKNR
ncbi:putative thiopurine S-methyltransferase [Amblyomma americanum]